MTASYIPAQRLAAAPEPFGLVLAPEPWTKAGLCQQVDPDLFFPERDGGRVSQEIRALCDRCPSQGSCLGYALRTNQREGFWGGLSQRELNRLRKAAKR